MIWKMSLKDMTGRQRQTLNAATRLQRGKCNVPPPETLQNVAFACRPQWNRTWLRLDRPHSLLNENKTCLRFIKLLFRERFHNVSRRFPLTCREPETGAGHDDAVRRHIRATMFHETFRPPGVSKCFKTPDGERRFVASHHGRQPSFGSVMQKAPAVPFSIADSASEDTGGTLTR
jgi:hypothetical protein